MQKFPRAAVCSSNWVCTAGKAFLDMSFKRLFSFPCEEKQKKSDGSKLS